MANFSELSGMKQWGAVILGGALVTAALYFTVFKSQSDKNTAAQHALEDKVRENNELESYRPKLKEMERQLANLKQQLEIERRIVPDEKQVDDFIDHHGRAKRRRRAWKCGATRAKPINAKEYYTEVPFDMELDGPYYSMLNFFRPGQQAGADREHQRACWFRRTKNPQGAKAKQRTSTRRTKAWWRHLRRLRSSVTIWSRQAAAPGAKPATARRAE